MKFVPILWVICVYIRHAILHAKRIVRQDEHKRLKKLNGMVIADEPIHIS